MSVYAIIMYGVVGLVGLPAAFRNPTAAALTITWLLSEFIRIKWPAGLSLSFMADITVIAAIFAKAIVRAGANANFRRFMPIWDKAILAIFLLGVWPAYVLEIHPYYKWFLLWGLTITQFLLAGAETAQLLRNGMKTNARSVPTDNGMALVGVRYGR